MVELGRKRWRPAKAWSNKAIDGELPEYVTSHRHLKLQGNLFVLLTDSLQGILWPIKARTVSKTIGVWSVHLGTAHGIETTLPKEEQFPAMSTWMCHRWNQHDWLAAPVVACDR